MKPINRYLDHAVLKPEMTLMEAADAIQLGVAYNTRTVCVRPTDIELAKSICSDTSTDVCVVLAFPHGCITGAAKTREAIEYAEKGVQEIDMVANYGLIRSAKWALFEQDIAGVCKALHSSGILLKVILETSVLEVEEISQATRICASLGVDYVKTSTGFNGSGATIESVDAMLKAAKGDIKVKASGGIRNLEQALTFIEMGCERLGIGSATTPILCGTEVGSNDDSVY